jgi:hypothetical protein
MEVQMKKINLKKQSAEQLLVMLVNWSDRLTKPFTGGEQMTREEATHYVKRIRKEIIRRTGEEYIDRPD